MDAITAQSQGRATITALMHAGNDAYDAAIVNGESAFDAYLDTVTALRARLNSDEFWLCPACRKTLTPIDTLCVYCESEENDGREDRAAQAAMSHGR